MIDKPESQIEKEKDAVKKLTGARSAMDSALKRIHTLEDAIKTMRLLTAEARNHLGENLYIRTYYHEDRDSGSKTIPVSALFDRIRKTADSVL